MTGLITIWDGWHVKQITGKLVKRFPLGITIDDDCDVRHYATFDRVISGLDAEPQPSSPIPGDNASLFKRSA